MVPIIRVSGVGFRVEVKVLGFGGHRSRFQSFQPYWAVGVPCTQQFRAGEVLHARRAAEFAALEQRLHWAASLPGLTPEMDAKLKSAATHVRDIVAHAEAFLRPHNHSPTLTTQGPVV